MAPSESKFNELPSGTDHPLPRRDKRKECSLYRIFSKFATLVTLGMVAYLVYETTTTHPDRFTHELSLLRKELHSVNAVLEEMPKFPDQSEKMKELVSKMTIIIQQLGDLTNLEQGVTKIQTELAETKQLSSSANDKLDGLEVSLGNVELQSLKIDSLQSKLDRVDSKTDFVGETLGEVQREVVSMQRQLESGSQSRFSPNGMYHIFWIAILYFLFK